MTDNTIIVRPGNKGIVFVSTDSDRIFNISQRRIMNDGLIHKAVEVPASYLAELYAGFGVKPSVKYNSSTIRRFRKEEVV